MQEEGLCEVRVCINSRHASRQYLNYFLRRHSAPFYIKLPVEIKMATSSLIKVKIQRNVPAKGGEGSTAGSSAETNGSVDDKKESSDVGQQNEKRKDKMAKKTSRFEPYNPQKRYRAFISNIPFDVKWQSLKDLVKEKVGEVTYVELLMDDEGKSRGCASVEFKLEDSMKKAVQILNKHVLSGRPLKVKEDLHGERLRRAAQSIVAQGSLGMGMPGPLGIPGPLNMSGPGPLGMGPVPSGVNMNIPANIMNNPNIPVEVIHALQSGRLGSTVFVANLDYTVGWKKLKEVFGISGTVVRADILEDKDGKSRGIGTVTYEQAIEAVQAISMFNGQPLFDRPMMVKIDDKSMPKGDHFPADRPPQLPRGLGGIGMGLGPGGQPLDTNHLRGSSGLDGPPIGGNGNLGNLSRFGSGMGLGRLSADIDRGLPTGFDRSELSSLSRSYSDSLDRGLGSAVSSLGSTIERLSSAMGRGAIDRVGSNIDRMGLIMDCMGPSSDRIGSGMGSSIGSLGIDISSNFERMVASGLDRINTGLGYGADRMGSGMDRTNASIDRMGSSLDRVGSGMDRVGVGIERLGSSSLGPGLDHVGTVMDRLPPVDCLNSFGRVGLDCIGSSSLDRMGTSLGIGSNLGLSMATNFDRQYDIEHNKYGSNFGGAGGTRSGALLRKGCQIFVRNLSFDCTWKMLKDKFNECGYVVYADIKMENGKSKGCGVVKFESPEVAERACRMMNGIKLGGREIDVRMDRNA